MIIKEAVHKKIAIIALTSCDNKYTADVPIFGNNKNFKSIVQIIKFLCKLAKPRKFRKLKKKFKKNRNIKLI
jgi:ribosomal protein S2